MLDFLVKVVRTWLFQVKIWPFICQNLGLQFKIWVFQVKIKVFEQNVGFSGHSCQNLAFSGQNSCFSRQNLNYQVKIRVFRAKFVSF